MLAWYSAALLFKKEHTNLDKVPTLGIKHSSKRQRLNANSGSTLVAWMRRTVASLLSRKAFSAREGEGDLLTLDR